MKNVEYRNAWSFLDEFRGKEFEGMWPGVTELFRITTMRFPDNVCFRSFEPDRSLTYTEAWRRVEAIAAYLEKDGVRSGDKIAVMGHNSSEWALAYFAVIRAGAIIVPLDNQLKDSEAEHFMEFGGVTRIFAEPERLDALSDSLVKYSLEASERYPFIMEMEGGVPAVKAGRGQEVAAILFTSGTTGTPKGVMLTHDNLVSDCLLTQANLDIRSTDRIYAILPVSHAYTMEAVVYSAISTGGAVIFGRKLAMTRIMSELKEGEVTILMAVPMLYNKMIAALMNGVRKKGIVVYGLIRAMMKISGFLKIVTGRNVGKKLFHSLSSKLSLDNVRTCISGGGPLPTSTFKMFNELGIDFVQGYGLTEASPITHVNPVEAYRLESVGKKFPMEEVRIINPDSEGNGVICIKGPMVMKGYYNNPEATAEVLSEDGWLNTGDVGHQDEDGYLYLTGRAKNVIVTEGGKNVFPEEIEDRFQLCSEIEQCCVIGYEKDAARKAEGIAMIVVPSEELMKLAGSDKSLAEKRINEIVDAVNHDIQQYKRIDKVIVSYEPLPMTSTKKVRRNDVKVRFGSML